MVADGGRGGLRQGGGRAPVPDLAIVTGRAGPGLRAWLMRARVPHLAAAAEEAIGIVGPLVRPGETACLRCLDITRASLDPAWPLILAQLADREAEPPACDAALAAAVAGQAAAQALAFLDRAQHSGAAENGTLEMVLPGWQWRRRSWPQHAACGCRVHPAA
jgi:bacteriocin biosynthesis cyclodehydratase domain-containing protein